MVREITIDAAGRLVIPKSMRERLHLLHGTLQLAPHQPHGLTVAATLNLRDLPHQPPTAVLRNTIPTDDLER